MAILIKGMKMPKPKFADITTVYNAYVLVHPNGHAVIVVENEDGLDSTEYPLTPVPPHGDLIDRDTIDYYEVERNGEKHYMVWKPHIDGMPTIVEADE